LLGEAIALEAQIPAPPDGGLAELIGIGPQAATKVTSTRLPEGVDDYPSFITLGRGKVLGSSTREPAWELG
jgi:hypothetical protein